MKHSQNGFTLIELLIVIAIIGILAAVLVPNLVSARSRAVDVSAQSYLRDALTMQQVHHVDNNTYTTSETVLLNMGMKPKPSDVTFKVVDADANGFCMTSTRANGSKTFFLTAAGGMQTSDDATVCTTAQ